MVQLHLLCFSYKTSPYVRVCVFEEIWRIEGQEMQMTAWDH